MATATKKRSAKRASTAKSAKDQRVLTDHVQANPDVTPAVDPAPNVRPDPEVDTPLLGTEDKKGKSKAARHENALREIASGSIIDGQVLVSKRIQTFALEALRND